MGLRPVNTKGITRSLIIKANQQGGGGRGGGGTQCSQLIVSWNTPGDFSLLIVLICKGLKGK